MPQMINRNKLRLLHIIEACHTISHYMEGLSREDFISDPKTRDAIIYQLIIIGEAVIHTDYEILEKFDYPWFKVKAFRNYATHEYFNIQMWTVWDIVNIHIPELENVAKKIIDNDFK